MDVARHWRLRNERYGDGSSGLIGEECTNCGTKLFPPRDVCPDCRAPAKAEFHFSGKGEVYSYSTIYQAPASHEEQAPYTTAMIRLKEGPLVTAQLTDVDRDDIAIGMPVEMVTRVLQSNGDRGMMVYGYKFRPPVKAAE
ncbi:transcriptional regulator [Candidatus Woesebacteria bacterium RIFCSPHIGHO2_02_FULL_38_9]|uniref:Transcriptional regulator n=1 Tax=Candidatus Woesebacteria bacterium RIFCSPHIGHO2_01_FULL_39_28 TaxID=1802496 RepID=A0A1F7YF20_9BACT|nr:MAG: transcriptional regulator [Candidatus Woesebacteria bacterium RIFCSPHIGHO2_01_FULL_39_28]OGM31422.1 MAG: transcriptional regulator [Candidatus Woesebacteria bacterium RIFCSPHIGHO2_02_FULL_38_9]OGM58160.1 MAG: transcriptional regulator [Candidatus Woesebacteria bacterium RIFCSPLOWO2_01_FULL_38_20]